MLRVFEEMYNISGPLAECDGCESLPVREINRAKHMCLNETFFFGHKVVQTIAKDSALLGLRPANRSVVLLSLRYTKHVLEWMKSAKRSPRRISRVSGGLFALMIAAALTTGKIDAYGFETGRLMCCIEFQKLEAASFSNTSNASVGRAHLLRYKYYQPSGQWAHDKCCQNNENFEEFEPMKALSANRINFHISSIKPIRQADMASNKPLEAFRAPPPLEIVLIPHGSTHRDLWDPAWHGSANEKLNTAPLVLRRMGRNRTAGQNAAPLSARRKDATNVALHQHRWSQLLQRHCRNQSLWHEPAQKGARATKIAMPKQCAFLSRVNTT
uniref:Uncharacterized protein n=1 Tax=Chrysotila carterae TaxID=13221 RepID=A0A7S4EVN5_CHRCT|mmetsp:Transcript_8399/g.18319  ORF Transcript_8399/g.18319 Transcript_8399/m.18319 type:complete len:328 (-) Transcript_8399:263-1246(-)|eukprot:6212227-Pleurochrysis_carterae.AAC.4